jgi:hypothetical protein
MPGRKRAERTRAFLVVGLACLKMGEASFTQEETACGLGTRLTDFGLVSRVYGKPYGRLREWHGIEKVAMERWNGQGGV